VRCGRPILPGQPWDLDHSDDRVAYLGAAHRRCNRSAGGRLGVERQRQRRRDRITRMLTECALGIEISEARDHLSIAAAGYIDDDFILVELAAYLWGTDPVAEVRRLRADRRVRSVALDPRSPAATAVKPLRSVGIVVTELSTHDVALAHGEFIDLVAAGRLRHSGQPELTAAIRHGQQRRLGGGTAWERRGHDVDASPAVAAEIAVWAWMRRPPKPMIVISGQAR
jgi:hypothetical protein